MAAEWTLEAEAFDSLVEKMEAYGEGAVDAVNKALEQSGPDIYERINALIHPSGRKFKGHSSSATTSKWQKYVPGNLSITVTTTSRYSYLYFPDDGSNTRRHAGLQDFFGRGGEAASDKVLERCMNALEKAWEE